LAARYWHAACIAALLALAASLGWLLAPADDPPFADRSSTSTPRLDTLELPIRPPETGPRPALASERRPVLPGLLAAGKPHAPMPRLFAGPRAPAMHSPPGIFSQTHSQTDVPQETLP
jgi:hypothetical protein